ncbi:hypothetical protein [Runella slithyformis]|uniref:Outer membrane protein beta-barrel domain-containing protein n=1 Tax=Runella slithyformis (strain ATCC 29530 / DSM 19594 / LMG 11500 / NCIMB 11436 / LSU 4) TaxID=761193 RepID=A0A7U3ZLD1_RUNSL|nr:hypothetical protein [Runella slithyformis]AEI49328.1 hypothetical protein Runsl_2940 [Runella slithyformis DSM 19594]
MKKTFLVLLTAAVFTGSYAQSDDSKKRSTADVALSAIGGFSGALSYQQLYGIGKAKRFKVGWGVRLTSFVGKNRDYITAPARLTSGETGPQVLFVENILSNLDTLKLPRSQTNALNLVIHLEYSFRKIDAGFNIDAIGVTFGGKQTGTFLAKSTDSRLSGTQQSAQPTVFNLLLVSDNDLGSLNSELYARYWFSKKAGVRLGASFQFTEYTSSQKLTFENDRFRNKILMPFIALSIRL